MNEYILLRSVDALNERQLIELVSSSEPSVKLISFCNAQALDIASRNEDFLKAILDSNYILRDGIGTKVALKVMGREVGDNLNGTDLIPKLLNSPDFKKIMLFGSEDRILQKAKNSIESRYGKVVVSTANGFDFDEKYYLDMMSSCQNVDLVILAMGMPKQELLSSKLKEAAIANCQKTTIVNGGAILSFLVGEETRAPLFMRRLGLEWTWRMANDPKRLVKRYLSNAVLLVNIVLFRMFK